MVVVKRAGGSPPKLTRLFIVFRVGWSSLGEVFASAPTKNLLFLDGGGHHEVVGGLPLPNSIVSLVG